MNNEERNRQVRNKILDALLEMLKDTDIDDISVSDLVKKADVGRASFYRSYTDPKDVLVQEADRLIEEWEEQLPSDMELSSNEVLCNLLNFCRRHRSFYTALYQAGLDEIFMRRIVGSFPVDPNTPNPAAYRQSSLAYMIYGWIHEWILRGMQETGEELVNMIEQPQNKRH